MVTDRAEFKMRSGAASQTAPRGTAEVPELGGHLAGPHDTNNYGVSLHHPVPLRALADLVGGGATLSLPDGLAALADRPDLFPSYDRPALPGQAASRTPDRRLGLTRKTELSPH